MKKLMSLGCLMALVLAGAPAFAADWFTTSISTSPTGTGGSWTYTGLTLTEVEEGVISFNDWNHELVFRADEAKNASSSNSIVKTSVKFTALDGSEGVPTSEMEDARKGAKAGLTIVEDANEVKKFYGIVDGQWVELDGNTEAALAGVVPVKIEIMKGTDGNYVQYTVGTQILKQNGKEVLVAATDEISVQFVSYLGNVQALSELVGYAYGNTTEAKEEVEITETIPDVPSKIDYNPADLAARNVDVTDPAEVKAYLTTKQSNGQLGWVNATLGIDDTNDVVVAGTSSTKDAVTVDFGFAGNGAVSYKVDNATDATSSASIDTTASGIHTVEIQVTQNGTTVTVTNQQVGVMNTGKTLTPEEKAAKGSEKIFDIVAVPFGAFQGRVTVANVLNTAELTDHDMLYVLRKVQVDEGKYEYKYDTYELSGGVWTVVGGTAYGRTQIPTATTPDADVAYLEPDQAIWIERSVNSKIVFTGKGETTQAHSWTWKEGEYSLVANPTVKAFDLKDQDFGQDGDMIIVEDVDNPQQFEKVDGVWGEWQTTKVEIRNRWVSQLVFVEGGTIKAGIGFWYYNPTKTAVTINFGNNGN